MCQGFEVPDKQVSHLPATSWEASGDQGQRCFWRMKLPLISILMLYHSPPVLFLFCFYFLWNSFFFFLSLCLFSVACAMITWQVSLTEARRSIRCECIKEHTTFYTSGCCLCEILSISCNLNSSSCSRWCCNEILVLMLFNPPITADFVIYLMGVKGSRELGIRHWVLLVNSIVD